MSDSEDFDQRVAKLGQADETVGSARVVGRAQAGAGHVARAVLNAVDETILPAELIFASEAGETLTLSVAARRLRSVTAASDDLSPEDILGQELEPEEEAGLRVVLDLLDRFARGASGAVIVSERRGEENNARGVSATRLIEMLPPDEGPEAAPAEPEADAPEADAPAPDPAGPSGATGFLAAGGDRIIASLVRPASGEEIARGADDLTETLAHLADRVEPGDEAAFDLWVQQSGAPDGPAFGRAVWVDGTVVCVAFDVADVAGLVAAFRASRDN